MRYTAEEIDEMLSRGESRTDWAAVEGMTEEQLEASMAADRDDVHELIDWTRAVKGIPPRKRDIHIRLDEDVLDWFRQARPRLSDPDQQCAPRIYGEPQARLALVVQT